ncbi:MAG TPA: phosphodiesterase [Rhodospirillales bacterium]|nr:phosphodiesterase [Rhodospirillales bacterium]
MIIAQITDTHLGDANAGDPVFRARAENLRACVADINGLDPKPDAVIHTGDMTQHGQAAEFSHARALLAVLAVPLYVTPGNRDGREGMARSFAGDGYMRPNSAFVHYSVEDHPVRLVTVDSLADDGSNKGDLCDARLTALNATLAEAPARPTALFMHHPPFDVPTAPNPFAYQRRRAVADLAAVISRHPQVVRIFTGHMHRPWMASVGGVAASTVPSVATDLRKGDYAPAMEGRPVYQVHRFIGEGGFASETRLPVS